MIDLARYPKIWCSNCDEAQPLLTDEMSAGHLNAHEAADLMCGKCRFVIATLHAERHGEIGQVIQPVES